MNKQFSKEELYHSLPDFISGKLSDPGLERLIRNEIEINPEFKDEYVDLCDTFNFLESAQFESPSENYFNNLPVKINNLIDHEQSVSFLEKLAGYRKLFIPAGFAIIAAFIILFSFLNSNKNNFTVNKEEISSKSEVSKNKIEKELTASDTAIGNSIKSETEKIKNETVTLSKNQTRSNTSVKKIQNPVTELGSNSSKYNNPIIKESHLDLGLIAINIQNIENSDISDQEEDNIFIKESDDDNIDDDDILKLTPEEEKEILENLYNSKI